jgi:hypothetical protein
MASSSKVPRRTIRIPIHHQPCCVTWMVTSNTLVLLPTKFVSLGTMCLPLWLLYCRWSASSLPLPPRPPGTMPLDRVSPLLLPHLLCAGAIPAPGMTQPCPQLRCRAARCMRSRIEISTHSGREPHALCIAIPSSYKFRRCVFICTVDHSWCIKYLGLIDTATARGSLQPALDSGSL